MTEGTTTEEEVQWLKRTTRLIVGMKSIIIKHALAINHICIFMPIFPTVIVIECMRIGMTVCWLT